MRVLPQTAVVACLSVFLECNLPLQSVSAAAVTTLPYADTVQRVVDGDTLITEQTGRIRLIGLNTPETVSPAQKQGAPPGCYGPEASAYLKNTLPPKSRVRIETDAEPQDKYGRTLAYVYTADGKPLFVNAALIEGGYARTMFFPPNTKFQDQFKQLEAKAKAEKRGLWGDVCTQPAAAAVPPTEKLSVPSAVAAQKNAVGDGPSAMPPKAATKISSSGVASAGLLQNPGDTKNCADFATYDEAKAWFDKYFPQFGDVAKLDGNADGIPCESLRKAQKK